MKNDRARAHYQQLLAPIYRWMLGDLPAAFARSRAELESFGTGRAGEGARGLDLGAGLGLHAIPLAELGYRVTALDSSPELLAELSAERPDVVTALGDVLDLNELAPGSYDLILCLGDTLTHLPTEQAVDQLLDQACDKLRPAGTLALTFRDYASRVPEPSDRFILVRADADRILTCHLDYGLDRVTVTDLVHERTAAGWALRASAYPKLRLAGDRVRRRIEANGCHVNRVDSEHGRITIVATRSAL